MDEVHGSKNVLSEFIELSDTNYKFMDKKCTFRAHGPIFLKFMDLSDTNYKLMCIFGVRGPK
jgi:hypothetical protein